MKNTDARRSELSEPNSILVSILSSDIRENTGVQPTGQIVYFYETYLTNEDHFKNISNYAMQGSGKNLRNVAAVSIEGIFSPYSTLYDAAGDFPAFEMPVSTTLDATSLYLNPFNPFNILGTGVPSTGVSASGFARKWMDSGHNISFASVGSGVIGNIAPTGSGSGYTSGVNPIQNPESLVFDLDYESRGIVEAKNVRSVGLRSPMVLSGWGFDIDGNPVPSSGGAIHPEAFWNPRTWKTGPVDLRWDDDRKVWTGGTSVKIYLIKLTNTYNPACFSYEVDRVTSRAQYTRNTLTPRQYSSATGTLPSGLHIFPETGIYDPEYVAYHNDSRNSGCFEALNYTSAEYPYYEAFVIRETNLDPVGASIYNIWSEDCQDCGHVSNECSNGTRHGSSSEGKKILIENPLRQSFDVGDLAFSVKTGRKKRVYSGGFTSGSGVSGSGRFSTDASGNLSFTITSAGSGYSAGAFAIYDQPCVGLSLTVNSGVLSSGTITGVTTGYTPNQTYNVSIVPANASAATEELDIHWVLQAEFKSKQIVTHVECNGGILQTCTSKIQTQGFSTCEHCGEDSSLINTFL